MTRRFRSESTCKGCLPDVDRSPGYLFDGGLGQKQDPHSHESSEDDEGSPGAQQSLQGVGNQSP